MTKTDAEEVERFREFLRKLEGYYPDRNLPARIKAQFRWSPEWREYLGVNDDQD